MIVADPSGPALSVVLWTMLGGYLAAGGAGAINHYLDRDRDARMARTRGRPLVSGRIEPWHGLAFGIALGVLATVQLAITVNVLGAAGARRPARLRLRVHDLAQAADPAEHRHRRRRRRDAATGRLGGGHRRLAPEALYPFGIVFLWTPPHFWALSLLIKDDYARTGVPMLPVVKGEAATRRQIVAYALVLVAFTLIPVATGFLGALYLAAALVLGGCFVALAVRLLRTRSRRAALRLLSSLAYLALLFCAMALDRAI